MVSAIPTKAAGPRFEFLDYLRFLAAIAVLAYHWLFRGVQTGSMATVGYSPLAEVASYGYLGVELFFLISGFVIAISSRGRTASEFAVRRGVRLYPAFWVAMLTTAVVTSLWGAPQFSVTFPQVLANLTIAPNVFNQPLVDGVYWTLLNELIFYGMVFLIMLFGLGRWLGVFFPIWAVGMLVILIIAPQMSSIPLFGGLYSFFAAGAIISTIQRNGWSVWQAVGLVVSFYIAMEYTLSQVGEMNALGGPFHQAPVVTCVIVAFFFLLLLVQIHPRVTAQRIARSQLVGALTYPVYLLHAHLGFIFFNHFANDDNKWWVYAVALLATLALSYVLHRQVERKPRAFWGRVFDAAIGAPIRWLERLPQRLRISRATVQR